MLGGEGRFGRCVHCNTMVLQNMRDLEYRTYSFRLADETAERIKKLAREKNLSKNMLIKKLLNLAEKDGLLEVN
jgi:hypothetical protein